MQLINNKTNNLLHPTIKDDVEKKATQTQKICNIVLPILSLYQPAGTIINTGYTVLQLGTAIKEFPEKGFTSLVPVAYLASTTALLIFFPIGGLVIIHGHHLFKKDSVEIGSIFKEAAFLSSKIVPTPETLLLSLLAHAASEFHEAYKLSSKCEDTLDYLEVFSKIFVGSYKLHHSRPVMSRVQRNWFGKEMTQADFDQIMTKVPRKKYQEKVRVTVEPKEGWRGLFTPFRQIYSDVFSMNLAYKPVDFEDMLESGNYSNNLKDLLIKWEYIDQMHIKNINFTSCYFDDVNFENCQLENLKFTKCDLEEFCLLESMAKNLTFNNCNLCKSRFVSSLLTNIKFNDCNILATDFYNSILSGNTFTNSRLLQSDFFGSDLEKSTFTKCDLPETSFFQTNIVSSNMKQCNLTDTLLTTAKDKFTYKNCTENVVTRPVVAAEHDYVWGLDFSDEAEYALQKEGMIILHYDIEQNDVDTLKLKQDVSKHLQTGGKNIPEKILKSSTKNIDRINAHADEILTYVDGLLFPGGEDIQPELYGAENHGDSWCDQDYRHSLLQFALIQKGEKAGKPMLGICRGSQAINVALGGTLHQDVDDQWGFQNLQTTASTPKAVKDIVGSNFQGLSMHHQAWNKMGKGLAVVLKEGDQNIPKAFTNKDGTIIGYQFHPEDYWLIEEIKNDPNFHLYLPELMEWGLYDANAWSDKNLQKNRKLIQLFTDKVSAAAAA